MSETGFGRRIVIDRFDEEDRSMAAAHRPKLIPLDTEQPVWEHFFSVYPLVVVGSVDQDGVLDLAPKHLAIPMSWQNYFGFVCTPRHLTYQNVKRSGEFTVSYVRPSQVVLASLAASPRCQDGTKPLTDSLPTVPATRVTGAVLEDAYLYLECELYNIIDGFGDNSLITGRVVAAQVAEDALRTSDLDDAEMVHEAPLLAYLYPGRFAEIENTNALPFPAGFKR